MKEKVILLNLIIPIVLLIAVMGVGIYSANTSPQTPSNLYLNNDLPSEDQAEKMVADNRMPDSADSVYEPAAQDTHKELAEKEPLIENSQAQPSISEQDMPESTPSAESMPSVESTPSSESMPENEMFVRDMPETSVSVESNDDSAGYAGNSGNADNFNKYYHPELQETTDRFVINTESLKFHLPKCRDVIKMSYDNYATSNESYEELTKNYSPCGHCLKNY